MGVRTLWGCTGPGTKPNTNAKTNTRTNTVKGSWYRKFLIEALGTPRLISCQPTSCISSPGDY